MIYESMPNDFIPLLILSEAKGLMRDREIPVTIDGMDNEVQTIHLEGDDLRLAKGILSTNLLEEPEKITIESVAWHAAVSADETMVYPSHETASITLVYDSVKTFIHIGQQMGSGDLVITKDVVPIDPAPRSSEALRDDLNEQMYNVTPEELIARVFAGVENYRFEREMGLMDVSDLERSALVQLLGRLRG